MRKILFIVCAVVAFVGLASCARPGETRFLLTVDLESASKIYSDTVVVDPTGDEVTVYLTASCGVTVTAAGDTVVVDPTVTVRDVRTGSEDDDS
jgi:hypothetical protein